MRLVSKSSGGMNKKIVYVSKREVEMWLRCRKKCGAEFDRVGELVPDVACASTQWTV